VFIAATPYRNDAELEFALASYLLIVHHQGRCVFQPLPIDSKGSVQEGYSLANLRHIVAAKSYLLNVRLGDLAFQERHQVPIQGGLVWRRTFQFGVVYVNSSDTHHCSLQLGGGMLRANGQRVKQVELPPHSGVILLYPTG
jgi:hypothetical protein